MEIMGVDRPDGPGFVQSNRVFWIPFFDHYVFPMGTSRLKTVVSLRIWTVIFIVLDLKGLLHNSCPMDPSWGVGLATLILRRKYPHLSNRVTHLTPGFRCRVFAVFSTSPKKCWYKIGPQNQF